MLDGPVNVVKGACDKFLDKLRAFVTLYEIHILYEEELKLGFYEQIRRKLIALSSYHSVEDFSHL